MNIDNNLPLVYRALQRVNELRLPHEQLPEEPDLLLVGDEGLLDSLALTTLILALEDQLMAESGSDISLMAEADFDTLAEQFLTPRAIAELIARKI